MPDEFDPYHVWLGIPPEEQPANFYRLLGIRSFETNSDVIDSAADRQMSHLRTFQGGTHSDLSQRLLNEVAAARICLLKSAKKAAYDQQLRAAIPRAATATGGSKVGMSAAGNVPVAQALPSAAPVAPNQSTSVWDDLIGDAGTKPRTPGGNSGRLAAGGKRKTNSLAYVGGGVGLLLAAAVGVVLFVLNSDSDARLTFDWPAGDRTGATLTVDDQPVTIPANGPWEYRCPLGEHRIVALRPAFKSEETVSLTKGQQQAIAPQWKPKAVLVVNWPLAERQGAALAVDNQAQSLSPREPLELPVEPGRHVIHVTRSDSEPFETTVSVASDQRQSVSVSMPRGPTLVIDWPKADRKDARLTIDDKEESLDPLKLEFRLETGRHSVQIVREGFQPIDKIVEVGPEPLQPISPVWIPQEATLTRDGPPTGKPETVGKPIDLLALVDVEKHVIHGNWHKENGALVSDLAKAAEIMIPFSPTGEYEVTMVTERREGTDALNLGLVVGANQFAVCIDNHEGRVTGVELIDGKRADKNETRHDGKILSNGRPSKLVYTVRRNRLTVRSDDQIVIDWDADYRRCTNFDWWRVPDNSQLFIVTWGCVYSITKLELTLIAPQSAPADIASQPPASVPHAPEERKLRIPSAAEQAKIAKQLDEFYKVAHLADKDRALAEELFKTADEPGSSAAERYMLLMKGVGLAAGAGDLDLAWRGIDRLDAGYEIDAIAAKQKLLDEDSKTAASAEQIAAFIAAAESLSDQAIDADHYDAALAVAATASKVIAKRATDVQLRKKTEEWIVHRRRDIAALQTAWGAAKTAQKALEKNADDGPANLALGRWYSLYKGDWDRGLPMLVKGTDELLKALANQELAANLDAKQQAQVADGWWELAQEETGLPRDCARIHAGALYRLALTNLESPLKKAAIEQRLGEINHLGTSNSPGLKGPDAPSTTSQIRKVDLLKLVDVSQDPISGTWAIENGGLVSDAGELTRVEFPYQPPEEYDFEIAFTRKTNNDLVSQI